MKKLLNVQESTVIQSDEEGVVIDEQKQTSITTAYFEKEPDFVKLYLNDIVRLYDLPKSTGNILFEMIRDMSYDNLVSLGSYKRAIIAERLGIAKGTISNALTKFVEEGFLSKVSSTEFVVNPEIVGKGKWKDIKELRLTMVYNQDGKTWTLDRTNTQLESENE